MDPSRRHSSGARAPFERRPSAPEAPHKRIRSAARAPSEREPLERRPSEGSAARALPLERLPSRVRAAPELGPKCAASAARQTPERRSRCATAAPSVAQLGGAARQQETAARDPLLRLLIAQLARRGRRQWILDAAPCAGAGAVEALDLVGGQPWRRRLVCVCIGIRCVACCSSHFGSTEARGGGARLDEQSSSGSRRGIAYELGSSTGSAADCAKSTLIWFPPSSGCQAWPSGRARGRRVAAECSPRVAADFGAPPSSVAKCFGGRLQELSDFRRAGGLLEERPLRRRTAAFFGDAAMLGWRSVRNEEGLALIGPNLPRNRQASSLLVQAATSRQRSAQRLGRKDRALRRVAVHVHPIVRACSSQGCGVTSSVGQRGMRSVAQKVEEWIPQMKVVPVGGGGQAQHAHDAMWRRQSRHGSLDLGPLRGRVCAFVQLVRLIWDRCWGHWGRSGCPTRRSGLVGTACRSCRSPHSSSGHLGNSSMNLAEDFEATTVAVEATRDGEPDSDELRASDEELTRGPQDPNATTDGPSARARLSSRRGVRSLSIQGRGGGRIQGRVGASEIGLGFALTSGA